MATNRVRGEIITQSRVIATELRRLEAKLERHSRLPLAQTVAKKSRISRQLVDRILVRTDDDWRNVSSQTVGNLRQASKRLLKVIGDLDEVSESDGHMAQIIDGMNRFADASMALMVRPPPLRWCARHKHFYSGNRCTLT